MLLLITPNYPPPPRKTLKLLNKYLEHSMNTAEHTPTPSQSPNQSWLDPNQTDPITYHNTPSWGPGEPQTDGYSP